MKTMFKRIAVVSISLFMSLLIYNNVLAAPTSFTGIEDYGWFTRDTVHDLDFLDLNIDSNAFTNKDWYYFENGVNYGGRLWRLATVVEVCNIWRLAQPLAPQDGGGFYTPGNQNDPYIAELGQLFGWTSTSGSYDHLSGWTSTQASAQPPRYYTPYLWDQKAGASYSWDYYSTTSTPDAGGSFANTGAWLVAPVPLPGALWLMASGLAGLAVYRRKIRGAKR